MHIRTIEEDYEYRMKNIVRKFVKDFELEKLNSDELQEKLWNDYSKENPNADVYFNSIKQICEAIKIAACCVE